MASHCFISWKSQIYARVCAWVLYVIVYYTWTTPITGKSYVWFDPAGVQVAVAFVACRYFILWYQSENTIEYVQWVIIRINRIENVHLYTYLYGDMIGRQSIVKFWSRQDILIYSTLFFLPLVPIMQFNSISFSFFFIWDVNIISKIWYLILNNFKYYKYFSAKLIILTYTLSVAYWKYTECPSFFPAIRCQYILKIRISKDCDIAYVIGSIIMIQKSYNTKRNTIYEMDGNEYALLYLL